MLLRITGILICVLLVSLPAWADTGHGVPCSLPTVMVVNETELIPLTPFAELIGVASKENLLDGTVTLTRGNHSFTCAAESTSASVDGRAIVLPAAPVAQGDVLYVPLGAVVDALRGRETPATNCVQVKMPDNPLTLQFPRKVLGSIAELTGPHREVYAANADGSNLRRLTYSNADVNSLCLSPDGNSLLYCRDGSVILRALNSPQETILLNDDSPQKFHCLSCCFAADGATIIMIGVPPGGYQTIARIGINGQQFHLQRVADRTTGVVICPDGKQMAYATADLTQMNSAALFLSDLDLSHPHKIAITGCMISHLSCSKNGALLAGDIIYGIPPPHGPGRLSNSSIFTYALSGKHAGALYERPADKRRDGQLQLLDVSPDGQYILYSDLEQQHYWVMNFDQTGIRKLPPHNYKNAHFAPDSTSLRYTEAGVSYSMTLSTFTITRHPAADSSLLRHDGRYALFIRKTDER